MSRPVSQLMWFPDSNDPLSIWARWVGAGDHYTLSWGDGTSQRLLWNQPPVRHTYSTAGQYALLAERGLANNTTASATAIAVVRAELEAHHTADLGDDGRTVRLTLASLPEPVRYRIEWGDNTHSEHATITPAPTHTYPWDFGRPTITVRDLPSQRWTVLEGPSIGPEPEQEPLVPEWTFHHTFLPTGRESQPTAIRGTFHGRHLRPGARYGIRLNWSDNAEGIYAWAVADANGRAMATIPNVDTGWIAQTAQWYMPWRWCLAFEHGREDDTYHYIPITSRTDGLAPDGKLTVVYGIDPHNPRRVQVQVQKPQPGTYTIQWGDGRVQIMQCDGTVCCAWHTYQPGIPSAKVTVTGPNNTHGTITIGTANIEEPYVSRNDEILGVRMRTHVTAPRGDSATPIIANWDTSHVNPAPAGDGLPLQQSALSVSGSTPVDHTYRNDMRGKQVSVRICVPLRDPLETTLTIPGPGPANSRTVVDDGLTTPPLDDTGEESLHVDWRTTDEWDGGYSGELVITNHGPTVPGWTVTFTVDDPGVVREVWPSTAHLHETTDNRWRVTSHTPLSSGDTVRVGARIEPGGEPHPYPRDLTATPASRGTQS